MLLVMLICLVIVKEYGGDCNGVCDSDGIVIVIDEDCAGD